MKQSEQVLDIEERNCCVENTLRTDNVAGIGRVIPSLKKGVAEQDIEQRMNQLELVLSLIVHVQIKGSIRASDPTTPNVEDEREVLRRPKNRAMINAQKKEMVFSGLSGSPSGDATGKRLQRPRTTPRPGRANPTATQSSPNFQRTAKPPLLECRI